MPDPRFIATINAKGQKFSAWESVMVRRDFGDGISVFQFTPAEGAYGPRFASLKLQPGDPVTITLGGHKVITGAVTTRSVAYDATTHQLVIAGKSMTMDLKDSSVVVKPGGYDGSTFEQAVRGVISAGGHQSDLVMMNAPAIASKAFKDLSVQYGETIAEFASRIAPMRGLFLTDDENGNLVAGQGNPGAAPVAELVEGRNILRATGKLDDQSAWGKWSAVTQQAGDDSNWPPRAISASVTNADARPNRLKLFVSEHPGDAEDLSHRVNHEVVRSSWPVVQCSITVVGWLRADGSLWKPTENVSVYSPMIFPTQTGMYTLGIQSCTYGQDSQNGTTTTMELVLPNLLTSAPTAGIGDIGNKNPTAATPDKPDYST